MELELFGKSIDLTDKQTKQVFIGSAVFGVVFLLFPFILTPTKKLKASKLKLEETIGKKDTVIKKLKLTERRYAEVQEEYRKQKFRLDELQEKFKNSSFQDSSDLKKMIQEMLDHLNIELLEIGAVQEESLEGADEYGRKMIPYRIRGRGRDVAVLFYYLENSNFLITLKGSKVDVKVTEFTSYVDRLKNSNRGDKEEFKLVDELAKAPPSSESISKEGIEVQFKLGSYFLKQGMESGLQLENSIKEKVKVK